MSPGLDDAAGVISARDALERAAALEDAEAARALLDQANAAGDKVLADAINTRAHDAGWSEVVDYRKASPEQYREALARRGVYRRP